MAEYVDLSERVTATFYSDEYEEWTQKTVTIADVLNAVCDDYTVLPSAQRWNKCIGEPPKNKSNVLTAIYIPGRQPHVRSGWFEDGLFMNDNGDTWKWTDKEVIAWMYQPKLPEPWGGAQDDTD